MKVPKIRISASARLILYKDLREMVDLVGGEMQQLLELNGSPAAVNHQDSLSDWTEAAVFKILEKLKNEFPETRITRLLERALLAVELRTQADFVRQLKRLVLPMVLVPTKPRLLQEAFIKETLKTINGFSREMLQKTEEDVLRGIRQGTQTKEIAKQIELRTKTGKKRALLIANNATTQYSGELTKHNQKSTGIKRYRWETSGDERVRSEHRARNNKIYLWSSGGPHPREEVNCRCDAIPVLED